MKRDASAVRALLAQKVDVNAPGKDGTPALHWAVRGDDLATARLLLGAGADAEARQPIRRDAVVSRLRERKRGDDPAAARCRRRSECHRIRPGRRALMVAARVGTLDAVKVLLDRGADDRREGPDVSADGADGGRQGKPSRRRQAAASSGARDVNARTRTGETPAWLLPNSVPGFGHGVGIVRGGLPERGLRTRFPGAMSPLLYAARDGRLDIVQTLVAAEGRCEPGRRQRHHAA